VVPGQVRVVWAIPEPDMGNLHMSPERSLLLACLAWTPVPTSLFSVSMDLPLLDMSYEWDHTICSTLPHLPISGFFHLAS
jgi:hypothetical protein